MKKHELKTINPFFERTWFGKKRFEIRKNDRDFKEGDLLILKEYDQAKGYSGREISAMVSYVLPEGTFEGLSEGYCAMGLDYLKFKTVVP